MIRYMSGDMLRSSATALVNPVNCVGVAGAGLARQMRAAFPAAYTAYRVACENGTLSIGSILATPVEDRYVVHFPTKEHWRRPSRIDYIALALPALADWIQDVSLASIAVPALGCGLGSLNWSEIRPLIVQHLEPLEKVDVQIYGPAFTGHPAKNCSVRQSANLSGESR